MPPAHGTMGQTSPRKALVGGCAPGPVQFRVAELASISHSLQRPFWRIALGVDVESPFAPRKGAAAECTRKEHPETAGRGNAGARIAELAAEIARRVIELHRLISHKQKILMRSNLPVLVRLLNRLIPLLAKDDPAREAVRRYAASTPADDRPFPDEGKIRAIIVKHQEMVLVIEEI